MSALARLIAARMLGKSNRQAKPQPAKVVQPPRPVADLLEELQVEFTPPPAAPVVEAPPLKLEPGWRGSCKAIDADTGRRCRLPAHPGEAHRHERGPFFRTADPTQTHFRAREQLDAAATRRNHTNNEAP